MYFQNRIAALALRIAAAIASGAGLIILSGMAAWRICLSMLAYYTNLSNLACLAAFIALSVKTAADIKKGGARGLTAMPPPIKGAVLMMLAVTMLVYHFMLSATGFVMQVNLDGRIAAANILLHYIAPCLALADWLLFDKKNTFKRSDPVKWLAVPFAYFIFILIRGAVAPDATPRYPYYFLDADAIGAAGVAAYAVAFAFAFAALGYIMVVIDKLLAKYINPTPRS